MSGERICPLAVAVTALAALAALGALPSCEGGGDPASADAAPADAPGPEDPALAPGPQTPPRGQAALEPWLAEGHYRSWTCEPQIHPPRLNGAHGRHRICSNQRLLDSASGPYPVGAASVKELYEAPDKPNGFAVGLKITAGPGNDTWYWYERTGRLATLRPVADGVGTRACGEACHAMAPRDNVYIRAQ
jgi:hypothetical protein